ncbi:hypothetical protein MVEN_01229200 [Mycena venus]|uniref:C2H2-type domain-containing protein n=1 Tax=Mycena venus TaxID=2733690 RepID=A0A8H6Y227_9AGAR|nr:hypothetical protein MVEN_01229200 [Mycena venus]
MSQSSEYSPLQCRWKWCRNTYPTVVDLLEHVREHVRQTEPVYFRDLALHRRAEDGFGSSLSVITMGSGSDQSVAQNSIDPVPDACSLSLPSLFLPAAAAASPIPQAPLPVMDFSLLLDSPSRPLKRQKIMSPGIDLSLSHSRSNSTQTPPPRGLNRTPGFASLASASESSQAIPNPEVPDLDTLISQTLAGASSQNHFASPNGTVPHGSQSFSGSDGSVERHLTQDFDTTFEGAVPNFNDVLRANGLAAKFIDGNVPSVWRISRAAASKAPVLVPVAEACVQPEDDPIWCLSDPRFGRSGWSHSKYYYVPASAQDLYIDTCEDVPFWFIEDIESGVAQSTIR